MRSNYKEAQINYDFSADYWAGWILAYYQWKSGKGFRDIWDCVSMEDILKMYPTLHEAAEEKFVDKLNSIIVRKEHPTKLQRQRKRYGCSQKELAERSGVNLRTLQQYGTVKILFSEDLTNVGRQKEFDYIKLITIVVMVLIYLSVHPV